MHVPSSSAPLVRQLSSRDRSWDRVLGWFIVKCAPAAAAPQKILAACMREKCFTKRHLTGSTLWVADSKRAHVATRQHRPPKAQTMFVDTGEECAHTRVSSHVRAQNAV